ncbi:MAG: hypothetical protein IIC67_01630 [Thaumarchaeota archaeon]|nr:hypothetical protein [Nitrososphaerota archaeon]
MQIIHRNQFTPCSCIILDPENEVFFDEKEYVFATEEERPPWGAMSTLVHSKCGNPIRPEYLKTWGSKGNYITDKKVFFLK